MPKWSCMSTSITTMTMCCQPLSPFCHGMVKLCQIGWQVPGKETATLPLPGIGIAVRTQINGKHSNGTEMTMVGTPSLGGRTTTTSGSTATGGSKRMGGMRGGVSGRTGGPGNDLPLAPKRLRQLHTLQSLENKASGAYVMDFTQLPPMTKAKLLVLRFAWYFGVYSYKGLFTWQV